MKFSNARMAATQIPTTRAKTTPVRRKNPAAATPAPTMR
jgi:hypothetical protein